jgi:hypothetical protein
MNEIVTAARSAREKLSSALAVLQSPAAGNLIDSVAEPVAGAMSALHAIESTGGAALAERAPAALANVRRALEALQAAPQGPAADEATGHVAGCLGLVHQLAQKASAAQAPAAASPAQVRPSERPPAPRPSERPPAPRPSERPPAPRPSERPPAPAAQPAPHAAFAQTALAGSTAPGGALDRTQLADAAQQHVAPAQPAYQAPVQQAPVQQAPVQQAPAPGYQPAPVAQQQPVAASVIPASAAAAAAAAPRAPAGAAVVEAALGAHSPTNFYKGLSGNDVIDDGGVFIATYRIPRIGQEIWLRVSMPGGYEFDARAEVKWTRESGTSDAPPGFGAQFREISNEGRQLVYRYVRNREPLFHDDF